VTFTLLFRALLYVENCATFENYYFIRRVVANLQLNCINNLDLNNFIFDDSVSAIVCNLTIRTMIKLKK